MRSGIAPDWLRQVHRDWFFELDCGHTVAVDTVYCERTYIGLLEGRPYRQLNEEILERAKPNLNAWINNLIDDALGPKMVDWEEHFERRKRRKPVQYCCDELRKLNR